MTDYKQDSSVKTMWNDLAGNQLVRPYHIWEIYSDLTSGTTLPVGACNPDGTKSSVYLNSQVILPDSGSTDLPGSAVENFNSILQKILFPVNRPFFAFDVPQQAQEDSGLDETALQATLDASVLGMLDILKQKKMYSALPKLFENTTIIGNGLLFMGYKVTDPVTFISPADFVWRRTATGICKELIIREVIAVRDLPEDLAKLLEKKGYVGLKKNQDHTSLYELRAVQKYTYVEFTEKSQKISEYVEDFKVGETFSRSSKEPIFIPVAPNVPVKTHYGVGKVQSAISSILQVRGATLGVARLNSLISNLKFEVPYNAVQTIKKLKNAKQTDYIPVPEKGSISLMNFGTVNTGSLEMGMEVAKQEIARKFLVNSLAVRQAERVTAEEIRRLAEELTSVHSNLLQSYADQLQEPLVQYAMHHLELVSNEGKAVKDALQELDVKIITGTSAIDRVSESDNLVAMLQESAYLGSLPDYVVAFLKVSNILQKLAQARGIPSREIIKSQEEIQEEQQRAREAEEAKEAAVTQAQVLGDQQPQV